MGILKQLFGKRESVEGKIATYTYYVRRHGEPDLCWRRIEARSPEDAVEFARQQDTQWTYPASGYRWTTIRPGESEGSDPVWAGIDDEHIFDAQVTRL